MAAPPQSQSPSNSPANAPPQARIPLYQPPKTADEVAREQKRINLLLEINTLLLQHTTQLQVDGQGGNVSLTPQQQQQQQQAEGAVAPKMASQEFILQVNYSILLISCCMRCMQANITWLAASASAPGQGGNARSFPGPAFMESPINNGALLEKYEELRKLFPGWKGTMNARPGALLGRAANMQGSSQSPAQAQAHAQAMAQAQAQTQMPISGQPPPQMQAKGQMQTQSQGQGPPNLPPQSQAHLQMHNTGFPGPNINQ